MATFLQFIAVTVLGLVSAWLAHQWFGLFDNQHIAFLVGFPLLLLYGFIYDRHQARKRRRDTQGWQERD